MSLYFKPFLYVGIMADQQNHLYITNSLDDLNRLIRDWTVANLGRYARIVLYFEVSIESYLYVSNVHKFLCPKSHPPQT